nr:MAG TPA: hypothetical protein [Caudoviricetes sp.]
MDSVKFRLSLTTEQRTYLMEELENKLKRAIKQYEKYGVEMPVPVLTDFIANFEGAKKLGSLIGYGPIGLFNVATPYYKTVKANLINKGYKEYLV